MYLACLLMRLPAVQVKVHRSTQHRKLLMLLVVLPPVTTVTIVTSNQGITPAVCTLHCTLRSLQLYCGAHFAGTSPLVDHRNS